MAEVLSSKCSYCKKSGIVECDRCSNRFCATHFSAHRHQLDVQFEQLHSDREILFRQIDNHSSTMDQSQLLFLLQRIDRWEQQTLKNIQQTADRARQRIKEFLKKQIPSKTNSIVQADLRRIPKELRKRNTDKNSFEQDIEQLNKRVKRIQSDLQSYQSRSGRIISPIKSNSSYWQQEHFFNDTRLPPNYQRQLNEFYGKHDQMWQLVYRGTRDGFSSVDFHRCCDRKGPTLTVIQSSNGCLFGGYTSVDWQSYDDCKWSTDTNAFLFTLINPHNIPPIKYPINSRGKNAIACKTNLGPSFGQWDICIHSNSEQNNRSSIDFPSDYIDITGKGRSTFTGSHLFRTIEIEVYRLKHK